MAPTISTAPETYWVYNSMNPEKTLRFADWLNRMIVMEAIVARNAEQNVEQSNEDAQLGLLSQAFLKSAIVEGYVEPAEDEAISVAIHKAKGLQDKKLQELEDKGVKKGKEELHTVGADTIFIYFDQGEWKVQHSLEREIDLSNDHINFIRNIFESHDSIESKMRQVRLFSDVLADRLEKMYSYLCTPGEKAAAWHNAVAIVNGSVQTMSEYILVQFSEFTEDEFSELVIDSLDHKLILKSGATGGLIEKVFEKADSRVTALDGSKIKEFFNTHPDEYHNLKLVAQLTEVEREACILSVISSLPHAYIELQKQMLVFEEHPAA